MAYAWIITRDHDYEESVAMDMAEGYTSKVGKIRGSKDGINMFADRLRAILADVQAGNSVPISEDEVIHWQTRMDYIEEADTPGFEGYLLLDGQDGELEHEDPVLKPYYYSVNDLGCTSMFLENAAGEWEHVI